MIAWACHVTSKETGKVKIKPSEQSGAVIFTYMDTHVLKSHVGKLVKLSLGEKCPNTEFFLVRYFPHSDWIRIGTEYLAVFSPNAGKYGREKTSDLDTFHTQFINLWSWQCNCLRGTDSLLSVFLLSLFVILPEPHRIQRTNKWVTLTFWLHLVPPLSLFVTSLLTPSSLLSNIFLHLKFTTFAFKSHPVFLFFYCLFNPNNKNKSNINITLCNC